MRNITDIDDKIIKKANQENISVENLTNRYILSMQTDIKNLNLIEPNYQPRATNYINQMIIFIERLLEKKIAYLSENGDVYFNINKFDKYGLLSCNNICDLKSLKENKSKKDLKDFVLWKKTIKKNEPKWASPWGYGRPGWHLECSVMSMEKLGDHFDIHGGGLDLLFPHHENEKAQSESFSKKKMVNYWMHVGCLNIKNSKMSKSLKNDISIKKILKTYHNEVVRLFFLSSHYRKNINFSYEALDIFNNKMVSIYLIMHQLNYKKQKKKMYDNHPIKKKFLQAMEDDFNTSLALSYVYELMLEIQHLKNNHNIDQASNSSYLMVYLLNILGLAYEKPLKFLQERRSVNKMLIEKNLRFRLLEKKKQNWSEADRIRKNLLNNNIQIQDLENETFWYILK